MANLYQNPQFVNNSAPALNAANMNALANAAAANQSYSIAITIPSSGWSNNAITITATGVTTKTEGILVLAQNATAAQAQAAGRAMIRVTAQSSNSITLYADGLIPSTSFPAVIKVFSDGSMNSGTIVAAFPQAKDYLTATATLTVAGWSNKTQTVTVNGVTASNLVEVTYAPASATAWVDAFIVCTAQAANKLTFTCQTVPTTALTANIVIRG